MSAAWMLYALAVGALVTLAALAAEQSTRLLRRPGRAAWALAMLLTVALPLLSAGEDTAHAALPATAPAHTPAGGAGKVAGAVFAAALMAAAPLSAAAWAPASALQPGGAAPLARTAWLLLSALLAAALGGSQLALRRRRRQWQAVTMAGAAVLVAPDAGPAVVGCIDPRIVVPRWLLAAPQSQQALVLAHERAHIAAGDQRLLAGCMLLLVAMPWNLALWYQLRRLRQAIEVDCDARVLAQGYRVRDYGAALIDVGRRPVGMPALGTAMAESSGFLAQRLRLMTRSPARWHRYAAPLLLLLAIDVAVAAARILPPSPPQSHLSAISMPLAARQALAGYYQVGEHRVALVTVDAQGLSMKTNLEPGWPLLPASQDRFFVPASDLTVQFDRAAHTLTVLQMGAPFASGKRVDSAAVERADAWVARRVADQRPLPGGEAIVRRNIGATSFDQLTASDFTAGFLRMAEPLMPMQKARLAEWGKVEAVAFDGVNRWGWDRYKVRYANQTIVWAIWLDGDGRLANATIDRPTF